MEEEEILQQPEPEKVEEEKTDPIPDNVHSAEESALSKPDPKEPDGA